MSTAAIANAHVATPGRVVDRLLVWLPALIAVGSVAAYLAIHRELVLRPGAELLAALGSGGWAADLGLVASFALLLAPPTALLAVLNAADIG